MVGSHQSDVAASTKASCHVIFSLWDADKNERTHFIFKKGVNAEGAEGSVGYTKNVRGCISASALRLPRLTSVTQVASPCLRFEFVGKVARLEISLRLIF